MMSSESYIQMLDKIKKNTSKDVVPTKREDKKGSGIKQFLVLFKRYFKIIFMDKVSRNIMLLQAPLMFFILMLVKKDDCFKTFTGGKEILFTISCMTALMGILNAFLEICKEREILKREHRTGLRLIPYLMSKVTVLGIIGTLQAGFLVGGSFLFLDLPTHDLLGSTVLEYLMTLCLSIQASTAIGLLISSTAQTTERATLVMPAAIVLQLVFAGVLFKFTSVTRFISYFIVSKWTMSALGTLFNLNALPFSTSLAVNPPTVVDKMYLYEVDHLIQTWLALLLIMLVSYIMSYLLLSRNVKNNER